MLLLTILCSGLREDVAQELRLPPLPCAMEESLPLPDSSEIAWMEEESEKNHNRDALRCTRLTLEARRAVRRASAKLHLHCKDME